VKKVIENLKAGGVGVLRTDTLYGLLGLALNKETVEWIYFLKKRDPKKPLIVLISDLADLAFFGIRLSKEQALVLANIWPGKVSVVLPCAGKKFAYLHRGKNSIAFRLPKKKALIALLRRTGPLVAPSANPEKKRPARNISEAKSFFGTLADFYLADGTVISNKPSRLIELWKDGTIKTLR